MYRTVLLVACAAILAAGCTDEGATGPDEQTNTPARTRSEGVLFPLSVGNVWQYCSLNFGTKRGFKRDSILVTGTQTIDSTEWYSVYFSMTDDTLLLRNTTVGMERRIGKKVRLVLMYPATERLRFQAIPLFWDPTSTDLQSVQVVSVYDTIPEYVAKEQIVSCVTYKVILTAGDTRIYTESFAPGIGFIYCSFKNPGDPEILPRLSLLSSYSVHK